MRESAVGFDIPHPPPKLEHAHLPGVDRVLDWVNYYGHFYKSML